MSDRYNLHNVVAHFPKGRLSVVAGFSGAGKTTLILDSLIPAIKAAIKKEPLPAHISQLDRAHIHRVVMVDSVPVGKNVRSTVATYSGILDTLRALFADTPEAKQRKWTASNFSYNVASGACPNCKGTGTISLDIQYLPDMVETCPVCHGKRYNDETLALKWHVYTIAYILALNV